MTVTDALLDSWDRQCRIVDAIAGRIDETNRGFKPSHDGMSLDAQLAHIHKVRLYFLQNVSPEHSAGIGDSYVDGWTTPINDLDQIKELLKASGKGVRDAVEKLLINGVDKAGWYDNPVLYLQHMLWHDGWHVGLIVLALRGGGQEIPESWEEKNVWDEWRTETW